MNDKAALLDEASKRLLGRVRKTRMAELVRMRGFMSSGALAAEFGVSEMTVRRDLAELGTQGEVLRTHGGAMARETRADDTARVELSFDDRSKSNRHGKLRIAAAAERLVHKGHAIVLDVGTTTYELAACLASRNDVKVFTSDLRIGALLGAHIADTYVFGGRIRQNEMSLCGPMAVEQAQKLWFDTAFIGLSGLTADGIFDYSIEEGEMKRTFLTRASRKVLLCDKTKFEQRSLIQIAPLDAIDTMITDAPPPPGLAAALRAAGVSVIVAPER